MYDNMTSYQQGFISEEDLTTLSNIEARLAELKKAEDAAGESADGEGETSEDSGEVETV